MKQYGVTEVRAAVSITCDRCQRRAFYDADAEDYGAAFEYLSFKDTAGYASRLHKDGRRWSIDLCEACTVEVLGPWIRYEETEE